MFSSMLSLLGSIRGVSSFITSSLRFRSSASAYLSRTLAAPTNNRILTWSGWVKRGRLGGTQFLIATTDNGLSSGNFGGFRFTSSDTLECFDYASGYTMQLTTTQVFRDPSAYLHIVIAIDSTQATPSNRVKLYINGVQVTAFSTATYPQPNQTFFINSAIAHYIGSGNQSGVGAVSLFDGYLTDVNFIDGQALTPASFGAIDSSTGVWAPRPYSGTYGTNGFYLKFANTSSVAALGNDSSGNNNTWTVNNVSLTAGATYDSMIDVPVNYSDGGNGRGNYAVLSPISMPGGTSSTLNGNLSFTNASAPHARRAATTAVSAGKWYAEATLTAIGGNAPVIGIASTSISNGANFVGSDTASYGYASTGAKYNNSVPVAYGATYTTNDVIGIALDLDAGTLVFYKNNVSQTAAYTGLSGEFTFAVSGLAGTVWDLNFGQRPFQNTTAWATLQAAGFRALNTNNLPTPLIANGANFMAATTYTGTAGVRSISNAVNSVSFQPDLVWIKSRTPGATNHALFNSVRGATKYLSSNTADTETTNANTLTAFGADGFSLGTDTTLVNANANSYVAWQWKAGGTAVSNTQGTITSQVSANTTARMSVVTYTGTGTNNATVGHGLGVAPKFILLKNAGTVNVWFVYHSDTGSGYYLRLNETTERLLISSTQGGAIGTSPNSTTFTLQAGSVNSNNVNEIAKPYVAYCFSEIAGFSRFGSYTGNGLADGPFVFCGFRPRWVMIKETGNPQDWIIHDTGRAAYNADDLRLLANLPGTELNTGFPIDELSNGFKIRNAGNGSNRSGGTYIFAAFAENPSKYALAR